MAQRQCDDGVNDGTYGTCNPDCTLAARCGDGQVQTDYGEAMRTHHDQRSQLHQRLPSTGRVR